MDHRDIYERECERYDRLVSAEDCDGNLGAALRSIVELTGAAALEVGAGTGRLTRILSDAGARVVASERSQPMLRVARARSSAGGPQPLLCADARALPVKGGWADLAIAGWVFGHLRHWLPDDWRSEIGAGLSEMRRALKPEGVLIVIETLGTGREDPAPPNAALAEYYGWLEGLGLTRLALRTDYSFTNLEEAAETTGFFFGEDFAARVRQNGWARVPECTGLWWRRGTSGGVRPPPTWME